MSQIETLNGMIWGSGYPDRLGGVTTTLEREQAGRALSLQSTGGANPYSDKAMWNEFCDAVCHKNRGIAVTSENWRDLARQESARLYGLGFTQVHTPVFAQKIFTNFRTGVPGAQALDPAVFPSGNNDAADLAEDALKKFDWQYITGESVKELGRVTRDTGRLVKNTTDSAAEVAKNVSNPVALSSLAILALIGGGLFIYNKVT